ncbi:MAG: transcriptional antiterminator, Rof [Gammaproteobacteria bacterium]
MSDYTPIGCAAHERLEYAVLKRQWLDVTVKAGRQRVRLLPLDVYTRDGAEWIRAEMETGAQQVLRLDAFEL